MGDIFSYITRSSRKAFCLFNENIDFAGQEVEEFLAACHVERREALRIKLTVEELLLGYQAHFGEEIAFELKCVKRFSSIKIEVIVAGAAFNPLASINEADDVIHTLLAGIGLAPSWNYRNGKNYTVFIPKVKPISTSVKMAGAILLALVSGMLLNLLPDGIRSTTNTYLLLPTTDAFIGLITAVSVPLIFFSVLGSILSMGNMETLGKIGGKLIKTILLAGTLTGILITAFGSLFLPVT